MDTRSKKCKFASVLAALLATVLLTSAVMGLHPVLEKRAESKDFRQLDSSSFRWDLVSFLAEKCYRVKQNESKASPAQVMAPEYVAETNRLARLLEQAENGRIITSWQPMPTEGPGTQQEDAAAGAEETLEPTSDPGIESEPPVSVYVSPSGSQLEQLSQRVETRQNREENFNERMLREPWMSANLDYWVKDTETGAVLSTTENPETIFENEQLRKGYQYAVELELDGKGSLRVVNLHSTQPLNADHTQQLLREFEEQTQISFENAASPQSRQDVDAFEPEGFKNVRMIAAVPLELRGLDSIYYSILDSRTYNYLSAGFGPLWAAALVLAAALGLALGLVKKWKFGEGRVLRFLPVEGLIVGDVLLSMCGWYLVHSLAKLKMGMEVRQLALDWMIDEALAGGAMSVLYILAWAGSVLAMYLSFLSYAKIFTKGLWPYLKERSWLVRLCCAGCHGVKRLWGWATNVQLSGPEGKWLWKLALVNGAAIVILCCGWFFAIPVALIYSAVTYVLLRKKCAGIRADYEKVLTVASKMAEGDLNAADDGDAGIYEPLKQEMGKVRQGFSKAVDAELKSQSMKTELITNVSHDLKTPLTAIITYVDLLKKPDITEEERQSYIDTLDKKSQRLKQLIADLFDVSKAVSREMTPDLAPLDLGALLRQVRFELDDQLKESGLDFRWDIPEEKVPVLLDGARTGRIFENLLVNITKYALPGTRAYVALNAAENEAVVSFKNVSAAELPEDPEALAERFVRGDASRSTEGSGLGLAIVRSFTELQGGRLELLVDGDLFKAVVHFPLNRQPQEPEPAQQAIEPEPEPQDEKGL